MVNRVWIKFYDRFLKKHDDGYMLERVVSALSGYVCCILLAIALVAMFIPIQ